MGRRAKEAQDLLEKHRQYNPSRSEPLCPLCARPIPASEADEHHMVPRSQGGKATRTLHWVCHRYLHATFTEKELAQHYATPEALLAQD